MVKVSAGSLTKMRSLAEKAMARAAKLKEKGEVITEQVTRTMVTGGTAFGLGVLQGKTGGTEVMGMPIDLLVGAGAHVAGFMGVGGRRNDVLHNVGDGALAAYAVTMGRSVGMNWKTSGKLMGSGKVAGSLGSMPTSGGDFVSDQDLAASILRR